MSIDDRDYMQPEQRRIDRLRSAMAWERQQQLLLFPSRWQRFTAAGARALRSEWFNVVVFLLMVLTAVLWSATEAL